MNAVVDIGNSRTKVALFEEGRMLKSGVYPIGRPGAIIQFIRSLTAQPHVIVSDVGGRAAPLVRRLKAAFSHRLFEWSADSPLPVTVMYRSRKTLGSDRIANAAGATFLFPRKPVLVIDAGTCLKMDIVDGRKRYKGGSIAPGLQMRFSALNQYTARLPLVKPATSVPRTGDSTQGSIVAGVQMGMLYEMEGAIRAYRKDYRQLRVILTGGDWAYFANSLKNTIFVAPDLTLLGLNEILNFNHSRGT